MFDEAEARAILLALVRLERQHGIGRAAVRAIAAKIGALEELWRLVPYWFVAGADSALRA